MKLHIIVSLCLIFSACELGTTQVSNQSDIPINNSNLNSQSTPPDEAKYGGYDLSGSKGLLTLKDFEIVKDNIVRFYNKDGTIWYEFKVVGDEFEVEGREDFRPFRADFDRWFFALNVIGMDDQNYNVKVNDQTGLVKYVPRADKVFRLQSWGDYILNCYAVDFDPVKNSLRDSPNGPDLNLKLDSHIAFRPEEIAGEWVKLRWSEDDSSETKVHYGWVKWKEKGILLLNLFEIA